MTTTTDKLAAALRTVDEFCQAGLNSGEPAHMEAALADASGIAREAIAEYDAADTADTAVAELIECVAPLLASLKSRITQENAMTEQAVMVRRAADALARVHGKA